MEENIITKRKNVLIFFLDMTFSVLVNNYLLSFSLII